MSSGENAFGTVDSGGEVRERLVADLRRCEYGKTNPVDGLHIRCERLRRVSADADHREFRRGDCGECVVQSAQPVVGAVIVRHCGEVDTSVP
jgi:hypothetical protein